MTGCIVVWSAAALTFARAFNPFAENNSAAYDVHCNNYVAHAWTSRAKTWHNDDALALSNSTFHFNAIGLVPPSHISAEAERLLALMLPESVHRIFRKYDLRPPYSPPPDGRLPGIRRAASLRLLNGLHRDGFAIVDNFGLSQRQMDQLSHEANTALNETLGKAGREPPLVKTARELPSLQPILENVTIRTTICAYLGGVSARDCVLSGYITMRLTNALVSTSQYISGLWHHDACGRRVKVFIYLEDTDPHIGGRVTYIARGSHDTLYYTYERVPLGTRFDEQWVNENYEAVPMTARRGGGFLFDTNAVHKASIKGDRPRNVVVVEFDLFEKSAALKKARSSFPCPSGHMHYLDIRSP